MTADAEYGRALDNADSALEQAGLPLNEEPPPPGGLEGRVNQLEARCAELEGLIYLAAEVLTALRGVWQRSELCDRVSQLLGKVDARRRRSR